MKYPANNNSGTGEQVNYSYHPQMLLNTVGGMNTYVRGTDYDSSGRVQLRRMGTTLQVDYAYYNWTATNGVGRLQYIWGGTSSDADSLQKLYYTYDAVGNVKTIKDYLAAGGTQTQTFGYDALERLTGATATGGSGGTYSESYVYASYTGNLSSKGGVSYAYNDTAHKHAVTHLGGVQKYWYDANGNMITRIVGADTYSLTYDVENRLTQVKKNGAVVASFVYDGDGTRVKSVVGATTTAFVGSYFEWTGSTSTMVKYYYAGSTRLAMRVGTNAPSYLLGDHLGSTSITASGSGSKIAEMRYLPWGGQRYASGTTPTAYRFTGQREESSIGLYFYGARFYDPYLNRWIQPDSIIPNPRNPADYDRYAYVRNNPIIYVDDDGHIPIPVIIAIIGFGLFMSQYPGDGISAAQNPGDGGVMAVGFALMLAPFIAPAACLNNGDCTDEAQAVNQVAQSVGDPSDEINAVSNFTQADLPAVEQFAQNAAQMNPERGYRSFGATWNAVAQSTNPAQLFINRAGNQVTGMMQVGTYRGGGYEIKMLEGLGNGAGTSLFRQAIMDSMSQGYGGSIYLMPTEQATEWYLANFPGAMQLANGYLYWSSEAAQSILGGP